MISFEATVELDSSPEDTATAAQIVLSASELHVADDGVMHVLSDDGAMRVSATIAIAPGRDRRGRDVSNVRISATLDASPGSDFLAFLGDDAEVPPQMAEAVSQMRARYTEQFHGIWDNVLSEIRRNAESLTTTDAIPVRSEVSVMVAGVEPDEMLGRIAGRLRCERVGDTLVSRQPTPEGWITHEITANQRGAVTFVEGATTLELVREHAQPAEIARVHAELNAATERNLRGLVQSLVRPAIERGGVGD